jgi:hypothetical protein
MGRQVMRMHKDFEWPMNKVWWGYNLYPMQLACQTCLRDGEYAGKNSKGEYCPTCEGELNVTPKVEPPGYESDKAPNYIDMDFMKGKYGWQMWETVSEGSPISPVCDSPEELARWLADSGASSFGSMTATYEQWLGMIGQGSAVSMMYSPETGIVSGVEVASQE